MGLNMAEQVGKQWVSHAPQGLPSSDVLERHLESGRVHSPSALLAEALSPGLSQVSLSCVWDPAWLACWPVTANPSITQVPVGLISHVTPISGHHTRVQSLLPPSPLILTIYHIIYKVVSPRIQHLYIS